MTHDEILELAGKHISLDRHNSGLANQHELTSFANALLKSYKTELLKEVGEPVAMTNQAQLGYVTDGMHPDIPLAMWAKETSYSGANIALYTSDQLAAAILKTTKPLEERIQRRMDDIRLQAERQVALEEKFREVSTQLAAAQEEWNQCSGLLDDSLRSIEMLEDQLATAEQRVAEACALLCMDAVTKSKGSLFLLGAIIVAGDIRDGEWRKFVKEV